MAIVATTSDLYRGVVTNMEDPDPLKVRGVPRYAIGTVANAADDSSGSTYKLARVPYDAILLPDTFFDVENWGFAQVVIGSLAEPDQLLDVARSTATTQSPFAFGDANHGKRVWELLGLPSSPGHWLDLYAHAEADATGAGSMPFVFAWLEA
ncbi:MAG: hypothetical protein AAF192_16375 [Pseudomonadota bacterium]